MSRSKAEIRAEKAAQVKAAQQRRERNRRWLSIGAVVGAMALIVGGAIAYSSWQKGQQDEAFERGAAEAGQSAYGVTYGDPGAEHTVVIYEDFLCPHCAALEHSAGADLSEQAEDGTMLLEFRPVAILGEDSERALNAFKAVLEIDPAGAKVFHDALFDNQSSAPWSDDELVDLAVRSGVDEDAVRDAIETGAHADWVEEATEAARQAGLQGTPTILLDGKTFSEGGSWEEIGANLVEEVGD